MAHADHVFSLFDKNGKLRAVQISAELWLGYREQLEAAIQAALEDMEPTIPAEPLQEWEDFKKYWDFKYPYSAEVECGHCGAKSEDWLHDPAKPFRLKSAQLGGLAVFACLACGATVRKKHFKDHVCFEFSPKVNPR